MQRDLDSLREHIRRRPGTTALEVGAALGMATPEIAPPIKKRIATGDIRKPGVKSNTRYYPTDSGPPASADRRAGNGSPRSPNPVTRYDPRRQPTPLPSDGARSSPDERPRMHRRGMRSWHWPERGLGRVLCEALDSSGLEAYALTYAN